MNAETLMGMGEGLFNAPEYSCVMLQKWQKNQCMKPTTTEKDKLLKF